VIQERLVQLEEAKMNCDARRMLFLVRTSLTRNLGNMGNISLYKHTHVGTKDLIERYINTVLDTFKKLLEMSDRSVIDGFGARHMMEQVILARQAFGRSALLLSGGATFGMSHSGVLKCLWEQRLLPRIISGASAGSIVCSVLCTRTDEEVPELMATFCHGDLAVFEEEGNEDTVLKKAARFLKHGALFDISHLVRVMKDLLGDITFQEAYNRTRRILNICVSSASLYELPRLLNYITAPNVLIWSAVAASCSVPLVYTAATILAKDPRTGEIVPWNPSPQKWIDGSVDNDLPMTRLSEMFNVNHFIVSQVNPHVIPFIKEGNTDFPEPDGPSHMHKESPGWIHTMTNLARGEAVHRMHTLIDLGIFPTTLTKTVSVLNQTYSGDITILPEISYADMPRILSNPTVPFMENAMLSGERATWPKLSRIRNHLAIELALDETVQSLRERVVFSSSQTDLRLRPSKTKAGGMLRSSSDRSRGRRRRQTSNCSEPDALVGDSAKRGRIERADGPSRQKSNSLYSSSQNHTEHYAPDPRGPQILVVSPSAPIDPASSGADTSNTYTSDSHADQSSSSIGSPASPTSPDDDAELFTSYSVPASPATHRRNTSFFNLSNAKPLKSTATRRASPPPPPDRERLRMSRPEATYKKLFHGARVRARSPSVAATNTHELQQSPTSGTTAKRPHALGLNLDMSGTRGMVSRKKRTER
jgi:TAG lipase/steryl ester hydrolase/phospholipase A2/LPA acyltransferase